MVSLHFLPEFVHPPGGTALDFDYLRPFHYRGPSFSHRVPAGELPEGLILDRLGRIQEELAAQREDYPLAVKTHLRDVLFGLSRHYRQKGGQLAPRDWRARDFERLREVFKYLRKNCHEPVSLDQVARRAHMSRAYFCRYFKAVTGSTLTEYLLRLRVDLAMEFLSSGAMSVSEIAYATGFSNHSHLDRVFKHLKGVTPVEYRRQRTG